MGIAPLKDTGLPRADSGPLERGSGLYEAAPPPPIHLLVRGAATHVHPRAGEPVYSLTVRWVNRATRRRWRPQRLPAGPPGLGPRAAAPWLWGFHVMRLVDGASRGACSTMTARCETSTCCVTPNGDPKRKHGTCAIAAVS